VGAHYRLLRIAYPRPLIEVAWDVATPSADAVCAPGRHGLGASRSARHKASCLPRRSRACGLHSSGVGRHPRYRGRWSCDLPADGDVVTTPGARPPQRRALEHLAAIAAEWGTESLDAHQALPPWLAAGLAGATRRSQPTPKARHPRPNTRRSVVSRLDWTRGLRVSPEAVHRSCGTVSGRLRARLSSIGCIACDRV